MRSEAYSCFFYFKAKKNCCTDWRYQTCPVLSRPVLPARLNGVNLRRRHPVVVWCVRKRHLHTTAVLLAFLETEQPEKVAPS
uniref:Uncharacterized protein n=1 Tax=Caenorhabditis japonica TaxID=281687 RepID=A0A8R1ESC3_CAEJA